MSKSILGKTRTSAAPKLYLYLDNIAPPCLKQIINKVVMVKRNELLMIVLYPEGIKFFPFHFVPVAGL